MDKIIGIGNALVDMMTTLKSDYFLEELKFPKGSMQLIDKDLSREIILKTNELPRKQASGGSAANTIHGLAKLGVETAYIGKIGRDDLGRFFISDLEKSNIKPYVLESDNDTGISIAMVSPDSERTMATCLGAAVELNANDLKPEILQGYKYLHLEGYLVLNRELVKKAIQLAKENYMLVSLDLASFNVVEDNMDFLHSIIDKVDIVFANEEEAKAFTKMEPEDALDEIGKYCEIAVVKLGKKGSIIKNGERNFKVNAAEADAIDTTGAGDLYASGFLYGLIEGYPVNKCGEIASLVASQVIEEIGAKISPDRWQWIYEKVKSL